MSGVIDSIKSEMHEAGLRLTIDKDKANQLCACVVERLRREYGGCAVYIPAIDFEKRNSLIKADFTGNNLRSLSKKYGMTTRSICRIVNAS